MRTISDALASPDSTIARTFGVDAARRLSEVASRAYARTTVAMLERHGGAQGTYVDHIPDQISPSFARATSRSYVEQLRADRLWRAYSGVLSAIGNSARVGFAAVNRPRLTQRTARIGGRRVPVIEFETRLAAAQRPRDLVD